MGLLFDVTELLDEIDTFQRISTGYIDASSEGVLEALKTSLEVLVQLRGEDSRRRWGIERFSPLVVKASHGEYQPGRRGHGREVRAEISSVWEVSPHRKRQGKRPAEQVEVVGVASTSVALFHGAEPLGSWNMDIGVDDGPGCHFHTQVTGDDQHLDVPRLPGLPFSPVAVAEFVIGELYQERWPEEASRGGGPYDRWRSIQGRRIKEMLEWQLRVLADTSGSPWVALKRAKPDQKMLART